jgi:cytochrome P450
MTFDQITDEVLVFLHGAFATTGKSIAGVLFLLAMNPEKQEKALNEIKSILSEESDEINEEKLSQLVYLDMAINETLRLMPLALIHFREASREMQLSELLRHL